MSISEIEKKVLARAARILEREVMARDEDVLTSPQAVRDLIKCRVGVLEYEVFGMLVLTNRHRLIEGGVVELFRGTVDSCSVWPRDIVKEFLRLGGSACIFYHNHPSLSSADPSDTDVRLTRKLVDALALIDGRVLDHFVVSGSLHVSMAERGLM